MKTPDTDKGETPAAPLKTTQLRRMDKKALIDLVAGITADLATLRLQADVLGQSHAAISTQLTDAISARRSAEAQAKTAQDTLKSLTEELVQARSERDKLLGYLDRVLEDDRIRDGKAGQVEIQTCTPGIERIRRGPDLRGDRNIPF